MNVGLTHAPLKLPLIFHIIYKLFQILMPYYKLKYITNVIIFQLDT